MILYEERAEEREEEGIVKTFLLALVLSAASLHAQTDPLELEGLWHGYDGEWVHVSKQLVALAEAIPPRSSRGARSRAGGPPAKSSCTSRWRTSIC